MVALCSKMHILCSMYVASAMVRGDFPTGHATVSPADAACTGQSCVVPYSVAQPNIMIANKIGYHPSSTTNRQGIKTGHWRVLTPTSELKILYSCSNFRCNASSVRNKYNIGTSAFMGEYGDRINITDLQTLNSSLRLVYDIEPEPITSGSDCRYTAQRAVMYSFEGEECGSACVHE